MKKTEWIKLFEWYLDTLETGSEKQKLLVLEKLLILRELKKIKVEVRVIRKKIYG